MPHQSARVAVVLAVVSACILAGCAKKADWKDVTRYAQRVGMSPQELTDTVHGLGTQGIDEEQAREVVALLACSGKPDYQSFGATARATAALIKTRHMSEREAVAEILGAFGGGKDTIRTCTW